LKNHADAAPAHPTHVGLAELDQIAALEHNLTGSSATAARQQSEYRERGDRLAAAALAHDANGFARHHAERDVGENGKPIRTVVERDRQITHRQQGFLRGLRAAHARVRWIELNLNHARNAYSFSIFAACTIRRHFSCSPLITSPIAVGDADERGSE